jgi:hypothetical protein
MGSDKDDNSLHSAPESTSSETQLGEKLPHIHVSDFSVDPEVGKTTLTFSQATRTNNSHSQRHH